MIVCPACQHHNPEGTESCSSCGSSLAEFIHRVCPVCGALNPADNTYCQRCFGELVPQHDEDEVSTTVTPYVPPERPQVEHALPRGKSPPSPERACVGDDEAANEDEGFVMAEPIAESTLIQDLVASSLLAREADEVREEAPAEPASSAHDLLAPADIPGDPLEGIESPLPIEASLTLPHRATATGRVSTVETDRYDAELFGQIASERASLREARHAVAQPKERVLPRWGRTVLYAFVLLAALVPRLTGMQTATWIQPRECVATTVRALDVLDENSTVLVAVEYGPTYAGELNPLALAALRHLARRNVRTVALCTQASGVGIAEGLFARITEETSDYAYGERHAILGYVLGQNVALRMLSAPLSQTFVTDHVAHLSLSELPVTRGLNSIRDFDAIVVLADDANIVRQWIEQVGERSEVALYALVSAKAEPALVPYTSSKQLAGLIGGAIGAAEYEVAVGGLKQATRSMDAYVALFLVLLCAVAISNVVQVSRRDRHNKRHARP